MVECALSGFGQDFSGNKLPRQTPPYAYTNMSASQSLHPTMPYDEIGFDKLVKILADNFNILADEVQLLSDRKTILEHKLRFAHEQVRYGELITLRLIRESLFYCMMNIIALDLESASAPTTDIKYVSETIFLY